MYLKCLEVDHFKSFGSYVKIPLHDGFTVVSGPNGSGKSNVIDSLLFCLGLSTTRGMRAEKLSDLLHQGASRGEAIVTATFGIPEEDGSEREWQVRRKLRVNGQNYASTYYMDDQPCTLTELHEALAQRRIYPEGYNVVLQGDVTGIISMNSRERREIIDEMAGVAAFDRKIEAARRELDEVEVQEDRLKVIQQELQDAQTRLAEEQKKAQAYKLLRSDIEQLDRWEGILMVRERVMHIVRLTTQIAQDEAQLKQKAKELKQLEVQIAEQETTLEKANQHIKEISEQEHLQLQTQLAQHKAQLQQLEQSFQSLEQQKQERQRLLRKFAADRDELDIQQISYQEQMQNQSALLVTCQQRVEKDKTRLDQTRQRLQEVSSSSAQWLQEQTQLRQILEEQQALYQPLWQQNTQLASQIEQGAAKLGEYGQEKQHLTKVLTEQSEALKQLRQSHSKVTERLELLQKELTEQKQSSLTETTTLRRLEQEQQEKRRQLDRLEAQLNLRQEQDGDRAMQVIRQANLTGFLGTVRELGRVEQAYELALSIAAGSRLNYGVVTDEESASQAIALLKQQRAGRATFLPLKRMQPARYLPALREEGLVDYAINLLEFDDHFADIFAFIFGDTLVFDDLARARRHLGRYRIVTLEGELLEKSGAMTGGSIQRQSLRGFAKVEQSDEVQQLSKRLEDINTVVQALQNRLRQHNEKVESLQQDIYAAQREQMQLEGRKDQLEREVQSSTKRQETLATLLQQQEVLFTSQRATQEEQENTLTPLGAEIGRLQEALKALEADATHQSWQAIQQQAQELELELERSNAQARNIEAQLQALQLDQKLCQEKIQNLEERVAQISLDETQNAQKSQDFQSQKLQIQERIQELQQQANALEQHLRDIKLHRDEQEKQLRILTKQRQQEEWNQQQLAEKIQQEQQQLAQLQSAEEEVVAAQEEIPEDLTLEELQNQRQKKQRKMVSLEPVNMLAIDEYARVTERLDGLTEKMDTLQRERTELLLRIENFDTLKFTSFMEAFDAVNGHFQMIFERLSDGDGHLQLDNPERPFEGGLTLVAHPKGKKVRRLESMSGGEKSLTALSFIFALQRYRPSPFYAFDEVDMFLDGANVELLANMLQSEAKSAQFLVVSLRRPMIERSDRTLGVTLASDGRSKILGMKIRAESAQALAVS